MMPRIRHHQTDLFEIILDDAPQLPVAVLANDVTPLVQALLDAIIEAERRMTPANGQSEVERTWDPTVSVFLLCFQCVAIVAFACDFRL
jgi:hypothetical protein